MHNSMFQYDLAMYNRIHAMYPEVIFSSPEECFKVNAKQHGGKVLLPFISIWRMPDITFNAEMFNDSFLRTGMKGWSSNDPKIEFPKKRLKMAGVPVTLQYQIDVYATKRDVCDGIAAELFLEAKLRPFISVQIMDLGEKLIEFNLEVEDTISDETDISSFDETNRFYRLTLTMNIPEAVLFRINNFYKLDKILVDYKVSPFPEDKKPVHGTYSPQSDT